MLKKDQNKEEKLVSIIVPLYNNQLFVEMTLKSVIEQTYKNWELIVIDDCSTDKSFDLVMEYSKKDDRVKVLKNNKNQGVVATRNRGITLANGEYIAFLDSDDLWKKEKLEKQINFMEKNNFALSYTGYDKITENGDFRGIVEVSEKVTYASSLKGNIMGCLTVIYSQKILGKKYFKEIEMSEDHVLWLEIIKEIEVCYGLNESLAQYRVLKNSRSSNKIKAIIFQWKINREIEKLNILKSIYYFSCYLWRGYKRYKL